MMVWSITNMIDLLCGGEVHSASTGIAGRYTKEGWQNLGN